MELKRCSMIEMRWNKYNDGDDDDDDDYY